MKETVHKNFIVTRLFLLVTLILIACGSTRSTVTESPKTLIPIRTPADSLSLTPAPETFLVTTRAGQEVRLKYIRMEPNEYVAFHTESAPYGIPMASGVEISFKYISQVDFGLPSPDWETGSQAATWPVTITLTDGTQITGNLGFKAHHQIHVFGDMAAGTLDAHLFDVQKIAIQRTSTPAPIPTDVSGENPISIETVSGETVRVVYPRVFTNCMYDVYCCHYDDITSLPLLGADIPLNEIQTMEFTGPEAITVTLQDGASINTQLRPSTNCPSTAWRIRGKAVLGDFEIELTSILKISR
jgi:hypothetical protein